MATPAVPAIATLANASMARGKMAGNVQAAPTQAPSLKRKIKAKS